MPLFGKKSDVVRAWDAMNQEQKEFMWIGVVHGVKFLLFFTGEEKTVQMVAWLDRYSTRATEEIREINEFYKKVPDSISPPTQLTVTSIIGGYEQEHGKNSWTIPDLKMYRVMQEV